MKITALIILEIIISYSYSNAQCYSNKGIMNEACKALTIISPPAIGIDVGLNSSNILKLDVTRITKDEIVYGASVGIRPYKTTVHDINSINKRTKPEDGNINAFFGYNLFGCIIIGVTAGATHCTNFYEENLNIIKKTCIEGSLGMSIKFISVYTKQPIVFGAYGSNAGIGITIGTIF